MIKKTEIDEFYRRLSQVNPSPTSELEYTNTYTLLVAVVLSAQATDIGVNKATGPLFQVADTPEKIIALGEGRLRNHIKTIGLFNTKAKNVMKLSQMLIDVYGGVVPYEPGLRPAKRPWKSKTSL
jgi:endonuclease-3